MPKNHLWHNVPLRSAAPHLLFVDHLAHHEWHGIDPPADGDNNPWPIWDGPKSCVNNGFNDAKLLIWIGRIGHDWTIQSFATCQIIQIAAKTISFHNLRLHAQGPSTSAWKIGWSQRSYPTQSLREDSRSSRSKIQLSIPQDLPSRFGPKGHAFRPETVRAGPGNFMAAMVISVRPATSKLNPPMICMDSNKKHRTYLMYTKQNVGFVGHDAACRFFRVEPIKLPSQPGELITFILRPGCVRVFASAFTPKQYLQWKSNDTSDIISSHPAFSHLFSIKYHHSKIPTIYVNNLIQHTASSDILGPFFVGGFSLLPTRGHTALESFQPVVSVLLVLVPCYRRQASMAHPKPHPPFGSRYSSPSTDSLRVYM